MNYSLLLKLLQSQDMGEKGITKIINDVENFNANDDPVTAVIINAFNNNPTDPDSMVNDLDYAINQLSKAKRILSLTDET